RYIRLARGKAVSVRHMLNACEKALGTGSSIMMFPEGTRSPDGQLRAFKRGAFELAKRTQRPILPIVITGTADALPKRGFVLRGRHRIQIQVLDEIAYEKFAQLPVETLTQDVHKLIATQLEGAPSSRALSAERLAG
ncbi:MAG: lysophospholipid acyltransferase family protein, partial [Deltaproteobacteria bacterium]|nr:lysophospholipid acyltransferase family protein [Deltaproteobacteria bacterium]